MQKVPRERAYTGLKLIRLAEDVQGAQTSRERHAGFGRAIRDREREVARKSRRLQAQRLFLNMVWLVQTLATVFFFDLAGILQPLRVWAALECLS
jgi:hypothetical protein